MVCPWIGYSIMVRKNNTFSRDYLCYYYNGYEYCVATTLLNAITGVVVGIVLLIQCYFLYVLVKWSERAIGAEEIIYGS